MVQNQDLSRHPSSGIRIPSAASDFAQGRTHRDTSKNMIPLGFGLELR
jgi:hypothetical protein